MKNEITFDDFMKLDIRVARIESVEEVEGADKLYRIVLDVGELGERMVVAGIKPFYSSEEIKGKLVPYLANLESKEIRGVMSQGMIMAAGSEEAVLLHPGKEIEPGEMVR